MIRNGERQILEKIINCRAAWRAAVRRGDDICAAVKLQYLGKLTARLLENRAR